MTSCGVLSNLLLKNGMAWNMADLLLSTEGHSLLVRTCVRKALVRLAAKRSRLTLKELKRSTDQMGDIMIQKTCGSRFSGLTRPEVNCFPFLAFGTKHYIWQNPNTAYIITTVKHGGGNCITLTGYFSSAKSGKLVRVES